MLRKNLMYSSAWYFVISSIDALWGLWNVLIIQWYAAHEEPLQLAMQHCVIAVSNQYTVEYRWDANNPTTTHLARQVNYAAAAQKQQDIDRINYSPYHLLL